ncbi:MAG: sigma-70 family RNA polymerase sigma factor [Thermoleophilaceae bacterium]|jgi:RNA polymerase sigma factor (sigma-70 family)
MVSSLTVEASALQPRAALPALAGRSPLLRLQSDEKLVALTRKGQPPAFEALVQRYESRLLAFCRHMLGSREDAEDVLQEVFAASYNAMLGDERAINVRPWLYRIARNRCLNHLRRPVPVGQDSMDIFERDGGATTSDTVHKREEFRQIVADVQDLPETQRTALLLREIDALSYDQIAEAMETTIPSVKSLLVRARVSLAEAAEARLLTCEEVRVELGEAAEGLGRTTAPVRRHLRNCDRCRTFRGELRKTTKALAAVYAIGPFVILKKLVFAKLFAGTGAAGTGAAGTGAAAGAGALGSAGAVGGASALGGGAAMGGASLASTAAATSAAVGGGGFAATAVGAAASKAAAGFAAAAIVAAGAVEVKHAAQPVRIATPAATVAAAPVAKAPPISAPQPITASAAPAEAALEKAAEPAKPDDAKSDVATSVDQATQPLPALPGDQVAAPAVPETQEGSGTATLPNNTSGSDNSAPSAQYGDPSTPPGEPAGGEPAPQPAPVAGEPSGGPPKQQPAPRQQPAPQQQLAPEQQPVAPAGEPQPTEPPPGG